MNLELPYSTSDTALAAYLIAEGYELHEIDYSSPRFEFIFTNGNDKITKDVDLYITSKALVDPATYNRVYRRLTRIIRNQSQWWGE